MSIQSVAHVCIKTTNLDATAEFYCDVLGMKKFFNFVRKEKVIGFYLKAASATFIEVFLADEVLPIGKQVLGHFCLQTMDLKGLRAKLVEHGHKPTEIVLAADTAYQFWVHDPNGMNVEFQEYTDKACQYTGQDVQVTW